MTALLLDIGNAFMTIGIIVVIVLFIVAIISAIFKDKIESFFSRRHNNRVVENRSEYYGDKQLDLEIEEFLNQIHIEVECCKNDMNIEDLEDIIPDKATFTNR